MYIQIKIDFFIKLNFCDNNLPLIIMTDENGIVFKISKLYLNKFEFMPFKTQFKKR